MKKKKSPGNGIRYFIAMLVCCTALMLPSKTFAQSISLPSTYTTIPVEDTTISVTTSNADNWYKCTSTNTYAEVDVFNEAIPGMDSVNIWVQSGSVINFVQAGIRQTDLYYLLASGLSSSNIYWIDVRNASGSSVTSTIHINFRTSVNSASCGGGCPSILYDSTNTCELVCNGMFDYHYATPHITWDLIYACPWQNVTQIPAAIFPTPDYFCSDNLVTDPVHLPNNFMGWQQSYTQNSATGYTGYAGILTYWGGDSNFPADPDYREYLQIPLNSTLIAGNQYKISFRISKADKAKWKSKNIGAWVSNGAPTQANANYMSPVTPQAFYAGYMDDTAQWIPVSGIFTAAGNETYLTIGSFLPDAGNTLSSTQYSGTGINGAYYYIDDVHLMPYPDSIHVTATPQTICNGDTVTLIGQTNISNAYYWTWLANPSAGGGLLSNYNDTVRAVPTDTIYYTSIIHLPNFNGCTIHDTVQVHWNPGPTNCSAGNDVTTCLGDSVSLSGTLGTYGNYGTWTTLSNTVLCTNCTSTTISAPASGDYIFISAYDSTPSSCRDRDTVHVTGMTVSVQIASSNGTTACDSMALYSPVNIDTNSTYTWQATDNSFSPVSFTTSITGDSAIVNWAVATSGAGGYIILTQVDSNGCSGTDTLHIDLCCISDTGSVFYNDTASVVFGSNPGTIFSQHFNINGTFLIDQDMTFIGCNFNMGPNASIVVSGGSTVDFQVDSLKAGCCEMWDGLIGMTVNDTIIFEKNSYLGDAVRGIVSMNGSVYIVKGHVTFNRNYVSITVNPYAGTHGGTVREATFTSVSANYCPSFSGTLLAPYTNQWPLYGIFATDVNSITFGNPASAGYVNTFTNLRYGIRTKLTNSAIYNNVFNTVNKAGVSSKAIWCAGRFPTMSPFNWTQYSVTVGGTAALQKNKFLNCPYGVYTDTAMSTTVINNKFLQTYPPNFLNVHATAIRVNNCKGVFRVVNIFGDTINNHSYGVYLYQNNNCNTQVNRNYIYRTQAGTTGCTAIYQICNGANIGTTLIDTNVINNVQYGIRLSNAKNVTADENRIYVRVTTSSVQPVRGIWAANSTGVKIRSNDIYKENPTVTNTSNWIGGIYVSNCAASKVTCNLISKIGYGILFDGSGSANSTVFDNQLLDTYTGIWLRNGGLISQQGDSLTANDNVWQGAVTNRIYSTGTPSLITYGFFSPFYYRPAGGVYLPTPSNNLFPSWSVTTISTSVPNPAQVTCLFTSPPSHGDGLNGDIAQGLIDFHGNEVAGTWESRESLYRLFGEDTTFAVGDSILINFKDSADAANLGKLAVAMDVHSKGGLNSSGELTAAYNSVTGISPKNDLETNYQIVESILLWHELNGGEFTDTELDTLRDIARLCPFTDGNAVYMARGLLAPVDTIEYGNSCTGDSAGYRIAAPSAQTDSDFTFQLFPNPSSGSITMNYQLNENETGVVEIYSIAGSLITSIQLLPGQQVRTVLLPELGAGMYLYKVSVNDVMKLTDRLVIIK